MKRHRRWFIPLALLGAIGAGVAWQARPEIKIGPTREAYSYVPATRVNAKPSIDLPLPGGARLSYPPTLKVSLSPSQDVGYAGFIVNDADSLGIPGEWNLGGLEFRGQSRPIKFKMGHHKIDRTYPNGQRIEMSFSGRMTVRSALGVPYALAPEYRQAKVQLDHSGEWTDVELPLAPPHKPVPLEATEASVGPWTIHARPKPWRATAVPAEFELEVEGPKGQELLIDYDWIHYGMWGYNPPKKCGIWAFSNKPYGLTVNPRMDVPMRGVLHVVKAVPVEFIVSKNPSIPNQIDLLYDGKCVQAGWRQNSCPPAAFGFKAFRIEDTFFGNATPMYLKDAIDPPAGSGWQSGSKFKDGQVIGGFAYRIVKSYPFELPLRRPVSKETLSFGTHPKL